MAAHSMLSDAPFVGRQAELAALQGAFETVARDRGFAAVTVVGEAGMGRTRLLQEFGRWVEAQPQVVRFFKARATPQSALQPHALLRALFCFRFGIAAREPMALARLKLEQGVRAVMGRDSLEKAHVLGQLLGFDFADSAFLRGILDDVPQVRERAFHYAALFFEALTATRDGSEADRRLVVLFLENIHWADEGSLDFVASLAQSSQALPMLLVCTTDPRLWDARPQWDDELPGERHTRLALAPLPPADSRALAQALAPDPLPTDAAALVSEQGAGNPLFLAEAAQLLADGDRSPTLLRATLRESLTLRDLLAARLAALPPAECHTLQRAAVLGQPFWTEAIVALSQSDAPPQRALADLQQRGWVEEQRASTFGGTQEWRFRHEEGQGVAYGSLPPADRQRLHGLAARWLAEQGSAQGDRWAGVVADHWERAGERALAAAWFERAAAQARQSYAPGAALDFYTRALALAGPAEEQAAWHLTLYEGLGAMAMQQARYADAAAAYGSMRHAAATLHDPVAEARAWTGLSEIQTKQGDYHAARLSAERAERLARTVGARGQLERARALFGQGWALMKLAQMDAALAIGEQALALSTALNARDMMARNFKLLGSILTTQGRRFEQAAGHFAESLRLYREVGDRQGEALVRNNQGVLAFKRGDFAAAVGHYEEALALAQSIGSRDAEGLVRDNLGEALVGLGDWAAGEAELRHAIAMAEAAGRVEYASVAFSFLARALLGQGQAAEALDAAEYALALGQRTGEARHIAVAWRALGVVAAHPATQGAAPDRAARYDPAACFAESVRRFAHIGADGERARALRAWARYALAQGDRARAETLWREAHALFAQLGMEPELQRMGTLVPEGA